MKDTLFDSAITAAICAGKNIKENIGKARDIKLKGDIDLVTEIDRQNEEMIFEILQKSHRQIGFLSEEGTDYQIESGNYWIVDPLDGTTNFAHGYPHVAVSIALKLQNSPELGVVYNPIMDELFYARKGKGAFLNKKRISVSSVKELGRALLSTGFPYSIREHPELPLELFNLIVPMIQGIRRDGAASLDLCYVASGRVDGFWEVGLKPWDIAAGITIVNEAGGIVTDFDGGNHFHSSEYICATNGKIHYELLKLIQQAKKGVSKT